MPSALTIDAARSALAAMGQEHVLTAWDALGAPARQGLLGQLGSFDLGSIPGLVERYVRSKPTPQLPGRIDPVEAYRHDGRHAQGTWDREAYAAKGRQLVAAGKVAAFTVAGGQGSRLGYDGPKGCFPGGPVTGKPLFQCLAEWILAARRRFGAGGREAGVPWYIMTSPANHDATVTFFRQNGYFGLGESSVMFFPQGTMPSFDMATGRMLMAGPGEISLNPDGHGGSLLALRASGALADMRKRGVEHISYTQIDNPLVRVVDPVFLGLHAFAPDSSGEMSSKMVPKAHAAEKVGVLCSVGGRTTVIEYSDLPDELAQATDGSGGLRYNAGNVAIHAIGVEFVERLTAPGSTLSLPYHRAEKKVAHHDFKSGAKVEPTAPNAVKLELFVFDAIPLATSSIVLETDRTDEFAPIKNATGADSPASSARIQTERVGRWLQAIAARLPFAADGSLNCTLEISPLTAMSLEELRRTRTPAVIAPGTALAL